MTPIKDGVSLPQTFFVLFVDEVVVRDLKQELLDATYFSLEAPIHGQIDQVVDLVVLFSSCKRPD